MYQGMNLGGKVILGLSGLLVPASSAVVMFNNNNISTQTNEYVNLIAASGEDVSKVEKELKMIEEKRREFTKVPTGHKFASSYKDAVDFHLDKRRCYIKVNLYKGNIVQRWYRGLDEIVDMKEKERIATAIHTLGGKKVLEDACYSVGMGGSIWIKEGRNPKTFWSLYTSKENIIKQDNYKVTKYQK